MVLKITLQIREHRNNIIKAYNILWFLAFLIKLIKKLESFFSLYKVLKTLK